MKGKMKVAVLCESLDMRVEQVDIPQIGPNEVLVRTRYVGSAGRMLSSKHQGATPAILAALDKSKPGGRKTLKHVSRGSWVP